MTDDDFTTPDTSTTDITTPPATRTPPPRLRQQILAAIDEEQEAEERRPRRWPVLLVAASLVVAAGAGGMALHRQGPDSSPADGPQPVGTRHGTSSGDGWKPGTTGMALADACRSSMPGQAWIGEPVISPSGNSVVLRSKTKLGVCIGTGTGQATNLSEISTGADGVVVVHDTDAGPKDHQVIAAAGVTSKDITDGLLGGTEEASTGNGVWIADRTVDAAGFAAEPDVMTVLLSGSEAAAPTKLYTFDWPGRQQIVALDGAGARDACTLTAGGTRSSEPAPEVHQTSQGHVVLLVSSSGPALCTATASGTTTSSNELGNTGIYQVAATTDGDSTNVAAMAGKLPVGVTKVSVRTPRGVIPATISDGWWVWEDVVPLREEGLEPERLWVQMEGGSGHSQWVEWKSSIERPGAVYDTASSLRGPATGKDLDADCTTAAPGSTAGLHSAGGHAVVLSGPKGTAICTSRKGFGYTSGWVSRPALDAATFRPLRTFTDQGPGMATAGGKLPAGVTAITYNTPDGPIPAVVEDGHWAFEQTLARWDASKLPTSVTVTGPGLERTIQLG